MLRTELIKILPRLSFLRMGEGKKVTFLCGSFHTIHLQFICRNNYTMQIFIDHGIGCNLIFKTNIACTVAPSCSVWKGVFIGIYLLSLSELLGMNNVAQMVGKLLKCWLCSCRLWLPSNNLLLLTTSDSADKLITVDVLHFHWSQWQTSHWF